MDERQEAAVSLTRRAMQTNRQSEALLLIATAQRLDPSINAEELQKQWLDQWLEQNKNRNGESSQ